MSRRVVHTRANTSRRHAPARVTLDSTGYRIAMHIINTLFTIAATGMTVFLLGPVAYELGI